MSTLVEFLFPAPAERTPAAILRWWERRRLPYNLMVGGAGIVSLGLANLLFALPPEPISPMLDWRPIVVFGVLANLCYGLGSVVEIVLQSVWRGRLLPVGPTLYRMGLTFSVGLALFPTLIAGLTLGFRILRWLL
jgi:hypothetical protein